ncbi:uncharacterized protein LOC110867102 [Helianthus annuus]|nr:uncharacterized protein LOC110867102 [Helianthus annuus]
MCIWDTRVFEAVSFVKNIYFLIVNGKIKGSGLELNVANVYAPESVNAKLGVWNELSAAIEDYTGLWLVGGDFNAVRDSSERRNSRLNLSCTTNFNNFIFNSGLLEYDLKGRRALSASYSDHGPILLITRARNFGAKPFRVFNSWLGKEGYKEAVEKSLEGINFTGQPDLILAQKFSLIRKGLKAWRDEAKKKEGDLANLAVAKMEELENIMETRGLLEEEEWSYLENKKLLLEIERRKTMDLKQRSRTKWALDGDENSKFFHAHVNARKAINGIVTPRFSEIFVFF